MLLSLEHRGGESVVVAAGAKLTGNHVLEVGQLIVRDNVSHESVQLYDSSGAVLRVRLPVDVRDSHRPVVKANTVLEVIP